MMIHDGVMTYYSPLHNLPLYHIYIYKSEGYSFSVSICNEQKLDVLDYTCVCCGAKHNMLYIPRVLLVKSHNSATD